MAKSGSKRVHISNCDDKREITATTTITLSGDILPYQLIYTGTTKRCLPATGSLPDGFLLCYNKKHWSNTEETVNILKNVIRPYCVSTRKRLGLPANQHAVMIWDDFSAHKTPQVTALMKDLNISIVCVPKNMTHLLAPIDLTVNRTLKKMEQEFCCTYVREQLANHLQHSPNNDFKLDTRLSILKPLHAKAIKSSYEFFQTPDDRKIIKSGWRAAGITAAVERCRRDGIDSRMLIDPFANIF